MQREFAFAKFSLVSRILPQRGIKNFMEQRENQKIGREAQITGKENEAGRKRKSVDMLNGPLTSGIILFALPIAASSMLQQLFNSADTAVVGRFADSSALAAVGVCGELVALLVSLSSGLSVGANVLVAHLIGEKRTDRIHDAVHTSILLALLFGIAGMLIGLGIAGPVIRLIRTPAEVQGAATSYFRIYFLGYPFLLLYDFGSALLRARGDSKRPFLALALSGILNVLLNLFFVIVCGLGVAGVSIATDLASVLSAGLVLWWLGKEEGFLHFSVRDLALYRGYTGKILQIGIPAALQGAVFCFANIFVQTAVNGFGTVVASGSAIAMNFEYFGYYMLTSFGQAATTFTSQNYAAGQEERCRKILKRSLLLSVLFGAAVTVPLTVFRVQSSALFSPDADVIAESCRRILLVLAFEPVCGLYEVPAGVLRGRGHSALPAGLMIVGICCFRITWILTLFRKIGTLTSLYIVFPLSWVLTLALMTAGFFVVMHRPPDRKHLA